MTAMRRVLVIGSPGAGKSTLARHLGRHTGLPLVHLDAHHWRPGWTETPPQEWRERVKHLASGDRWIMDGNYGGTLSLRLPRADTVIFLDYPVWLCLWRAVRRVARYRGRTREDMGPGCEERLDLSFLAYIARFPLEGRKRVQQKLRSFEGRIIRLRSPAQASQFLASLELHG